MQVISLLRVWRTWDWTWESGGPGAGLYANELRQDTISSGPLPARGKLYWTVDIWNTAISNEPTNGETYYTRLSLRERMEDKMELSFSQEMQGLGVIPCIFFILYRLVKRGNIIKFQWTRRTWDETWWQQAFYFVLRQAGGTFYCISLFFIYLDISFGFYSVTLTLPVR